MGAASAGERCRAIGPSRAGLSGSDLAVSSMSAPWVSVMRLGNLQLGRGLWASFQITGSPFFLHPAAIRARVRDVLAERGDPAYSSLGRLRQLQTTAVEPALSGAGGGFRFGLTFCAEHSFWAEP
jgi:hypothetical protein